NSNTTWRVKFIYDNKGNNNGTPDDPSDDSGLVTLEFRRADAAATSAPLVKTQFAVDLGQVIGGPLAAMGFTGATGGANAKQEIINFNYAGPNQSAPVSSVYVRGSSWLGADADPNP